MFPFVVFTLAAVLFVVAAFTPVNQPRLIAGGLFCLTLALLLVLGGVHLLNLNQ